jgi:hypothetical protein
MPTLPAKNSAGRLEKRNSADAAKFRIEEM